MKNRAARFGVSAAIVSAVIGASGPAWAMGSPSPLNAGLAAVTASVTDHGTYLLACGNGNASSLYVAGEWLVSLTGSRSDESTIDVHDGFVQPTFHECYVVPKYGAAEGEVTIQVEYVGAGAEVVGSGSASGAWGPKLTVVTP